MVANEVGYADIVIYYYYQLKLIATLSNFDNNFIFLSCASRESRTSLKKYVSFISQKLLNVCRRVCQRSISGSYGFQDKDKLCGKVLLYQFRSLFRSYILLLDRRSTFRLIFCTFMSMREEAFVCQFCKINTGKVAQLCAIYSSELLT